MDNKIKLYKDISYHLLDEKPSDYFGNIFSEPAFYEPTFNMLYKLKETEQSPIHHPEGNVWNHILQQFTDDDEFIRNVTVLIRWHMQILFIVKDLPFADIKAMNREVDIYEVSLLGFCDRLGRINVDRSKEEANIKMFIQKCKNKM